MKISIRKIYETPTDESLHLKISTPDGNNYNFRVPQESKDVYEFNFSYESMLSLHKILDDFIKRKSKWN